MKEKFRDQDWIDNNILNKYTVLNYFSTSPFYNKDCNNEILKLQTQYLTFTQESQNEYSEKLKNMQGCFYTVEHNVEDVLFLFSVKKEKRKKFLQEMYL